ncbi:MAG: GNAT family N-acetyltransferase [Pirellulales bacterium]
MIRPTTLADHPLLLVLAEGTGKFKPLEMVALGEVLADYEAANRHQGHVCITHESPGRVDGFAYYAPAAMTEGTWYLYWIAVAAATQARGIGGKLLGAAEEAIRQRQGRHLLIETSSLPHYELTRKFYLKQGYEQHALLRGYYAPGDDMVVFRKEF